MCFDSLFSPIHQHFVFIRVCRIYSRNMNINEGIFILTHTKLTVS